MTMNMLNPNQRAWGQYQTREQVREWRDPNDAQEIELAIARRRAEEARAREEKIRRNTENRTLRRQNLRTAVKQMQLDKHERAMQVIKEENEGVKYLIAQNEAQLKKNQSVRNFIRDNDPHRKAYLQMMAERAEAERRERQFLHGEISRLESIEKRLKRELRATLRAEEQRERGVRTREARRRAEEQARRAEELRLVEAQQRERRREEFEQERERRRLQGEIEKLMQMERNLEEQIRTVGRTDEDEG